MEPTTALRLGLLYAHLILCVFALQRVLSLDWQVLRRQLQPATVQRGHRHLTLLLLGLWGTGLLIAGLDLGFDPQLIAERPKLLAKLSAVTVLSLNGWLLRYYCFPRISGRREPSAFEMSLVMVCGAVSTSSWLMAAFFGIAKPLQTWPAAATLGLYGLVLIIATLVALPMSARLRRPQPTGTSSARA